MKNPNKPVISPTVSENAARYRAVRFFDSVNDLTRLPPDDGQEVAFAGRSNAGKSSAINVLTGQRQLARVSKTPGRTQLLNFFEVAPARYLVDLPGYGYAEVPNAIRQHWQKLLERYLRERAALRGLLLLMDIRHPLTELDRQMLGWCGVRQLPVHILLTKADKLSRGAALTTLQQLRRTLQPHHPNVSAQLFSALTGQGRDDVCTQLDLWLGY
ncbi:MAG TPA: ribosome biogenesis GTP-binding protein YihA/YsxC [Candidatus Competibacteraceae bacterium]|nr:MAG: YihA family ribosome biogenesis GTP-binding protein [Candidatus Competibacteraceae bacterium]HOB60797.1 ribosome biogenesis GTP-binding protein YihA/YsxC [Candidatus Competibacteraceae bacterium]HQA25695.1 ribosome biogenesis GTP-binding protein YihA/YsxC [Candidatus Competibacteraceae bacterium]HQD57635.1 ribosome biogenesis GTP-binding protein YihA/YsxC [Candidatus Competibacteraceae bacterium]